MQGKTLEQAAEPFVDSEKEVPDVEAAIDGANDILAEMVSDNAEIRKRLKESFLHKAVIVTKKAKDEDSVYAQYYDFKESAGKIANHRILAIDRGEKEGFLKVSVEYDHDRALEICDRVVASVRKEQG